MLGVSNAKDLGKTPFADKTVGRIILHILEDYMMNLKPLVL
jgi:hypothetical protein